MYIRLGVKAVFYKPFYAPLGMELLPKLPCKLVKSPYDSHNAVDHHTLVIGLGAGVNLPGVDQRFKLPPCCWTLSSSRQ